MTVELFADDIPEIDPNKDYFVELVGEDKRYKTPVELARGKAEADRFIEQIKKENATLRTELQGKLTLEQFLSEVKKPAENQITTPEPSQALNTEEIIAKLKSDLLAEQENERRAQNLRDAKAELEKNGISSSQLAAKARELGMTPEQATALAERTPKAFLTLFGVNTPIDPQNPITGSERTPLNISKKGKSHFDAIRKNSPREYQSREIQDQMYLAIREMGYEKFSQL